MTVDFQHIWTHTSIANRERKRMLAHVIEDATLLKSAQDGTTKIHLRFKGGRTETLTSGPDRQRDASQLYEKLEREIAPMFYADRSRWTEMMRHVIALNASFFNTHRMVQQYALSAYR